MASPEELKAFEHWETSDFSLEQRALEDVSVIEAGRDALAWAEKINTRKLLLHPNEAHRQIGDLDKRIPHVLDSLVKATGKAQLPIVGDTFSEPQDLEGLSGEFKGFYWDSVPEGIRVSYGMMVNIDPRTLKILTPQEVVSAHASKRPVHKIICRIDIATAILDFAKIHPDRARAILELFLPADQYADLMERSEYISNDPATSLDDAARYLSGFYVDRDTADINDELVRRSLQIFIESITTIDTDVHYLVRYGGKSYNVHSMQGVHPIYTQQVHKQPQDRLLTADEIIAMMYTEKIGDEKKRIVRFAVKGRVHESGTKNMSSQQTIIPLESIIAARSLREMFDSASQRAGENT